MFQRLNGAVKDAKSMTEYLLNDLKVPNDHIIQIYDQQATRDAIVAGFIELRDNQDIQEQDAIIIFYAGHGSEIDAPDGWETNGAKIQAIVPWDVNTLDSDGRTIEVIPDRTVATLLNDIARLRGDNIAVILDCCHASSGTRIHNFAHTETSIARSIDKGELSPLSPDVDSSIVNYGNKDARASVIPEGFGRRELRSHVLLAACGARELAWESHGQGEFTHMLLEILRANDITSLTYSGLMHNFPPLPTKRKQNPQLEGHNVSRILFSVLEGTSSAYIRAEVINQRVILKAGAAQGIRPGDVFEIYTSPTLNSDSSSAIATLEIDLDVRPYQATFITPNGLSQEIPGRAWALQVHNMSELLVYCSPSLEQVLKNDPAWREKVLSPEADGKIRLVERSEDAQISIDWDGMGNVQFQTHNATVAGNGMTHLPHTVPAQGVRVLGVLDAAAMWNWHLDRENLHHPWKKHLHVEFFRVKPRPGYYNPNGIVMTEKMGENLNGNGPIHLVGDKTLHYGMNIINRSGYDLYPYLFYFDASAFTIIPKFLGPVSGAGTPDAPLPAYGKLSLGHGDGGTIPFAYHVDQSQELDIGILKLFVTDTPVGFDSVAQKDSPFIRIPRAVTRGNLALNRYWDTLSLILVQRRPETRQNASLY